MITQITGTNIKGLSFVQDLDKTTLFIGPNGAGKSARIQALILALMGYIPGAGKQNAEILDNYGDGKEMAVGVSIEGVLFQRKYSRSGDSVSQSYGVGGKKKTKEIFSQSMGEAGRPVAIDIGAFMDLSDQKKIDAVMDLYPPDTDISKIVAEIEAEKTKINTLTAKAKSTEDAAARLTAARATMQMPVGTLADVFSQIQKTEASLSRARQDLKDAEIEAAKEKAAAEEKARAEKDLETEKQKAELEGRRKLLQEQAEQIKAAADIKAAVNMAETVLNKMVDEVKDAIINGPIRTLGEGAGLLPGEAKSIPGAYPKAAEVVFIQSSSVNLVASIQAILDALNRSGCTACAARLVAIRELRKYKGKEAA